MLESLSVYFRLLRFVRPYLWHFAVSVVGFLLFAASQPLLAKMMELIIGAIEGKNTEDRYLLPLAAVGIFFIRGVGTFIGVYFNDFVAASVIRDIRKQLFCQLTLLPAQFYDDNPQGELLHRLGSGVGQIQAAITTALKVVIREGFTVLFLLAYVFYLNWELSLVFLLVAPVLAFIVSYVTKRFKKIARKNEKVLAKVMQVSKEMIGNYGIVRGFGAEDYEISRYGGALDQAFSMQMKIRKLSALFSPLSQLMISIAMAVIIVLLLSPAVLESGTTGELVGYLTAIALIPKPLRQLSGVGMMIQRGIIGAEIIFSLLDEEAEKDDGPLELDTVEGAIRVNELSFSYPGSENSVLKGITFGVAPGEMVALVGRSGGGKSTIVSLLSRAYEVPDGKIYIDDHDINQFKLKNLRSHIAIVSQNIALFHDSIRNNVAYGDQSVSDELVLQALRRAHALEFVDQLPEGMHTLVGDNGLKLSGGQRQRISIARAFLKNAPILILDEATSALDNESETIVTQAIEELASTRTTLVIAHRLSTIKRADRLIVMDAGKIVESGTHDQLIQMGGYYSGLYKSEYK
ncbi:lipid A export permease/ATP-binding protein MsbA [Ketobacter sp.]|uniref:lipid A export permease/ATP-binding protein MsbA n=1 Tax=Ketobacter sp. TaxID=2083498 RepID=UPI0025BC34D9|nr:lipid A export permease/ATP-binding protein MsbA [Ketobacter sp.]